MEVLLTDSLLVCLPAVRCFSHEQGLRNKRRYMPLLFLSLFLSFSTEAVVCYLTAPLVFFPQVLQSEPELRRADRPTEHPRGQLLVEGRGV